MASQNPKPVTMEPREIYHVPRDTDATKKKALKSNYSSFEELGTGDKDLETGSGDGLNLERLDPSSGDCLNLERLEPSSGDGLDLERQEPGSGDTNLVRQESDSSFSDVQQQDDLPFRESSLNPEERDARV